MKNLSLSTIILLIAGFLFVIPTAQASKLSDIKSRGHLICGVNSELPGFGFVDSKGRNKGFDVDFCRAVAAAVGVKVKFRPLKAKDRFTALSSGEVDMISRNTTWTMNRDTKLGADFVAVTYYDGQGFMVKRKSRVKSTKKLKGASICVTTGTTTEQNMTDYFRSKKMKYKPVTFDKVEDTFKAYKSGRCDAVTTDASGLAGQRSNMKNPKNHIILPEIISKEPLGPLVAHGDQQWGDVVRWVINALINAEEMGITKRNAARQAKSSNPAKQRLLGTTGSLGPDTGLSADWALKAIQAVGNYGEIFNRNIGPKTRLGLKRGLNQLWSKGGILYAPPAR